MSPTEIIKNDDFPNQINEIDKSIEQLVGLIDKYEQRIIDEGLTKECYFLSVFCFVLTLISLGVAVDAERLFVKAISILIGILFLVGIGKFDDKAEKCHSIEKSICRMKNRIGELNQKKNTLLLMKAGGLI